MWGRRVVRVLKQSALDHYSIGTMLPSTGRMCPGIHINILRHVCHGQNVACNMFHDHSVARHAEEWLLSLRIYLPIAARGVCRLLDDNQCWKPFTRLPLGMSVTYLQHRQTIWRWLACALHILALESLNVVLQTLVYEPRGCPLSRDAERPSG